MIRPLAVVIAVLIDVLATGGTWLGWSESGRSGWSPALAVFVVATPIGLLLAQYLPARLARRTEGDLTVIHLGGGVLDALPRLGRLVIDTHGTVTTGRLVVTEVAAFDPDHERNLRWFAGALAHSSRNPIGRAIARLAGTGRTSDFTEDPEHGIAGCIDQHPVRVGAADWLEVSTDPGTGTTLGVEVDGRPMGHITVDTEVHAEAERQLGELRRLGITPVLVSATVEPELARVAGLTGVEEWYSGTEATAVVDRLDTTRAHTGYVVAQQLPPESRDTEKKGGEKDGAAAPVELRVVLPGTDGDLSISIRTSKPSVATVIRALHLARRAQTARRTATWLSWLAVAILLPAAAAGLLSPLVAVALALAVLVVVGLTVTFTVGFTGR